MKKLIQFILVTVFVTAMTWANSVEDFLKVPAKTTAYYGGSFSPVLMEKVRDFSGNAAVYLKAFDNFDGYTNHTLTDEEKNLFEEYFSYLPEKLQQAVSKNVYAIYFVDGMWYGAMTDFIFDENKCTYCTMFLNPDIFHHSLDEWLTYRDNTIFKDVDDKNKIIVESDSKQLAFMQTFFHEAVHVYDYINHVTPYQFDPSLPYDSKNLFFSAWKNMQEPVKKYQNKKFEKTAFYEYGTKIPVKNGKEILEYLGNTPFCTLYAATNWMDDLAEEVTFYYLNKKFGINYKVTYIKNGKIEATYSYVENQKSKLYDSLCKEITGL